MAVFKCKMCGGNLENTGNTSVITCEYCGTNQTISKTKDEILSNLFNRANDLRIKCEFDRAEQTYEKILEQDNTEAEAHWGIVLCRYGIEYVDDPKTGKKIPTCHRTSYEAITSDTDYIAAIDNADSEQKAFYEAEAKKIDEIQKNILSIARNEAPFDVFICYKETDKNGKRTVDSTIANDIYYQLTQEGFKVFYAPITLENKLGEEYEPYIFAALNSAKVMLVIGTKPEYFNAVWVKNEWLRYLKLLKSDRSKMIIPCYRDMDAYDLPDEFAHLQSQDMSKIGFISDLIRGVKKIFDYKENKNRISTDNTQTIEKNESYSKVTNQVNTVFNRDVLINYLNNLQTLEFAKNKLSTKKQDIEYHINSLAIPQRVRERNTLSDYSGHFGTIAFMIVVFLIALWINNGLNGDGFLSIFDELLSPVIAFAKIASVIVVIITIGVAIYDFFEDKSRFKIETQNEKNRLETEWEEKQRLKYILSLIKQDLTKTDDLLKVAYSINIIPAKYRNIYDTHFLYEYISTSAFSLSEALHYCDLDNKDEKQDSTINQQQGIIQSARSNALNEQTVRQNEEMLKHAIAAENNTELAAQYTKVAAVNKDTVTAIKNYNFFKLSL